MDRFRLLLDAALFVARRVGGSLETAGREAIEELVKAIVVRLFEDAAREGIPTALEENLRDRLPPWAKDLPLERLDELAAALAGFSRDLLLAQAEKINPADAPT